MATPEPTYDIFDSDFLGETIVEFDERGIARMLYFKIEPDLEACLREVCERKKLTATSKELLSDLVEAYVRRAAATGIEDPHIAAPGISHTERCIRLVRKWADARPN